MNNHQTHLEMPKEEFFSMLQEAGLNDQGEGSGPKFDIPSSLLSVTSFGKRERANG